MRRHQYRTAQTAIRNGRPDAGNPSTLLHSYDSDLNPSRPTKASPLGSSTIAGLPLELLDRLKAFPLFQSAPESFLLSIGRSLRPNVYQPSQEIIREGEDARAMYWLVRGAVRVTSRDGESTYAELKPGAFFGEIGILMDVPRTASVAAAVRSLVVRLNKEDLSKALPQFPEVERAIRDEARERLSILERKKMEKMGGSGAVKGSDTAARQARPMAGPRKRSRDLITGDVEMGDAGDVSATGEALSYKKRKSPSPGIAEIAAVGSTLDSAPLTIRQLLMELPLFAGLPSEILHFLGVNAQPVSFPPFTEILKQGSTGRDVYFVVDGDVEVLRESAPEHADSMIDAHGNARVEQKVRARLRAGQYFGEVTSLSLAPRRTATVRSVNQVECLLISGEVLDDLWQRCNAEVRQQVESEAKRRLQAAKREDVVMTDVETNGPVDVSGVSTESPRGKGSPTDEPSWKKRLPTVTFNEAPREESTSPASQMEPIDPDPFFNPDLDKARAKSRRSSLAPPLPSSDHQSPQSHNYRTPSPPGLRTLFASPLKHRSSAATSPSSTSRLSPSTTRRPSMDRRPSISAAKGKLPDPLLVLIFQHLDILDLMRFRLVSMHWWDLLSSSPDICHRLDLSVHNKHVTDDILINIIIPFTGSRPVEIDLSNCFHLTDEGFRALADACATHAKIWKMKSVWDVQAPAVLSLVQRAPHLEEIDLSNCRKVSDNLLARVVGWVVPENKPHPPQQPAPQPHPNGSNKRPKRPHAPTIPPPATETAALAPGTSVGAARLKRLTLSYCKHLQDRSMTHIAAHAAHRLESLDLTRCTSITDAGFAAWGAARFRRLTRLVLADCTYLSDQAVVGVVAACRNLKELDLSFCCALSDTATEVLSLGLPNLRALNLAFCGSAVSDNSLRCIGLHLLELRVLSVRGCVRVTGQGVEAVVEGCANLEVFDVSQCRSLAGWLEAGGVERVNLGREGWGEVVRDPDGGPGWRDGRVRFETVADGRWRVGGS